MAAYRQNKRASLPRFNEGRNPFALKSANAPAVTAVEAAGPAPQATQVELKGSNPAMAQAVAIAQKATKAPPPYAFKPMPKAPVQPAAKVEAKPVTQPAAKPVKTGWTMRLNPFRPPEPVAPPIAEQVELSLDTVKVVHNDLADADVEIVPVKSHAQTVAAPVLPAARQAWDYQGENLVKMS